MIEIACERLRSLGLTPALAAEAAEMFDDETDSSQLMRLTEVHRETVRVHDGVEETDARLLPRLVHALADAGTALAVGDWVVVRDEGAGARRVDARLPPHSHIVRRDADGRRHPVVSNVDTALLVMGLDDDFNLRRLERYLALAQASGVQPVVVLTKADIAAALPGRLDSCLGALRARIPARIEWLAVDATDAAATLALAPYLGAGQTLVLLGSSGAGKSTLTNTLLGAATQSTGPVREHDGRGKHTTTARSLHCLPGGACVIDTPGLRTLKIDADEATLEAIFDDVQTLAAQCRFRNCRHRDEPGCAVRDGVDGDRLRNYQKLLREARRDTQGPLERRQQLAVWKIRAKAARSRTKQKRDDGS
ncbi:MAG: ribosome small subunit-dependent GTPase A [Caldimonas sp.]